MTVSIKDYLSDWKMRELRNYAKVKYGVDMQLYGSPYKSMKTGSISQTLRDLVEDINNERDIHPRKQSRMEPIPEKYKVCRHPEHNPPTHICIPQGMQYVHVCPSCGAECILRSPEISFSERSVTSNEVGSGYEVSTRY